MKCCFCRREGENGCRVNAIYLCPDCLEQLLHVSPADKRYIWFLSAMRRAIRA